MTQGESGLLTLIDAKRLPEVPHFPELQTWEQMLAVVKILTNEAHEFKTFVVDTLNGAERMCHAYIRDAFFKGEQETFLSYGKGPDVALPEWTMFLNALDRLRETRKMSIILLAHTKVKGFKNPEGPDYDRYMPDMNEKTWGLSHKWADVVLFGNFDNVILGGNVATDDRKNRKGKATSDAQPDRILYAERRPAFDAKNRIGLPASIAISGEAAALAWADLMNAVKIARREQEGNK